MQLQVSDFLGVSLRRCSQPNGLRTTSWQRRGSGCVGTTIFRVAPADSRSTVTTRPAAQLHSSHFLPPPTIIVPRSISASAPEPRSSVEGCVLLGSPMHSWFCSPPQTGLDHFSQVPTALPPTEFLLVGTTGGFRPNRVLCLGLFLRVGGVAFYDPAPDGRHHWERCVEVIQSVWPVG